MNLTVYLALTWLALRLLPFGRPFLVVIALIPASIQIAATVSADAVSNGLAFVVVAATLRLLQRAKRGEPAASKLELVGYGVSLVGLAACKPALLPIIGVAFLIPSAAFGSLRRRVMTIGASLGLALAFASVWSRAVTSQVRVSMFPGADSIAMRHWIAAHPFGFVAGVWHGWTDLTWVRVTLSTFLPSRIDELHSLWLILAMAIAVVATYFSAHPLHGAVTAEDRAGSSLPATTTDQLSTPEGATTPVVESVGQDLAQQPPRQRVVTAAVVAGILFVGFWLIEVGVALSAIPPGTPRIIGVQGRYFIPYLPLFLLLSASHERPDDRMRLSLSIAPVAFMVAVNLWWLSAVYRTFYA